MIKHVVGAAACVALGTGAAYAGVNQLHVGVMAHNIQVIDGKNANREDGPSVELQLNFDSPGFLHWAGSPRPYIMASGNTQGDTSFGGVGLEWNWEFVEGWSLQPGLGYVVHDGELNNPYPNGSQAAADFSREHVLLGSRDLFRTSLGLTRDISEHWGVQLFYSHISHGQILGEGRNQGLDQLGLRLRRSFD